MKRAQVVLIIALISLYSFGQDTVIQSIDTLSAEKSEPPVIAEQSDTTSTEVDSASESIPMSPEEPTEQLSDEAFENPFLTGSDDASEVVEEDTQEAKPSELTTADVTEGGEVFEDEGASFDILVDIAIGISLPRFEVEPNSITTSGIPNFIFNGGIILPFAKRFYAGISLRFLQFLYDLSEFDTAHVGTNNPIYTENRAKESYTYLSAPIKVGMKFELGALTPFFYVDFEPAYLIAGYQNSRKEIKTTFPDSSTSVKVKTHDVRVVSMRNRFQPFVGGGIGLELSYGYGSIYLDAAIQYNPMDIDKSSSSDVGLNHASCKVLYFPITLGVRFYL